MTPGGARQSPHMNPIETLPARASGALAHPKEHE